MAVAPRTGVGPDSGDLLLVAAGDEPALRRLLGRWTPPVYAVFERLKEPSAAADATIRTFERLVRSAGKYDPATPFEVVLWGHVARVASDAPAQAPVSVSPARLSESAAARTAFQRSAVAGLPPAERVAFLLTRVARLALPAAAAAQGVSEVEARRRLVRALETLRGTLRPLLDLGVRADSGEIPSFATPPPARGPA